MDRLPHKRGYMKVELDLGELYSYSDASIAETLAEAIREEIKLSARRLAKDAVKKMEIEAKKEVEKLVKKDWKKIAKKKRLSRIFEVASNERNYIWCI